MKRNKFNTTFDMETRIPIPLYPQKMMRRKAIWPFKQQIYMPSSTVWTPETKSTLIKLNSLHPWKSTRITSSFYTNVLCFPSLFQCVWQVNNYISTPKTKRFKNGSRLTPRGQRWGEAWENSLEDQASLGVCICIYNSDIYY